MTIFEPRYDSHLDGLIFWNTATASQDKSLCIDMIVVNENNEVIKVDVKSVCRRARDGHKINRCRTPLQKKLDVKILYVDADKKECYFYKEDKNHLKRRTQIQKI